MMRAPAWGLLVLALTPALLWGCWSAPFSQHDDTTFIAADPLLRPDAPWLELWRPQPHEHLYYPLTLLSWRLDRVCWGPLLGPWAGANAWAAGVRTTNLLLHAGAAAALWLVLRRLGARGALAAFVTAAFALHPAACESVCWAVERKNVLAACLGFLACWRYLAARAARGYALAAALYAAALLAKPSALGLCAVLAVWEVLGRPRQKEMEEDESVQALRPWAAAARLAPWVLLSAAAAWGNFRLQERTTELLPPPGGSFWTAALTDVPILWRHAANQLWPPGLSAFYCVEPIMTLGDARLWAAVLPLLALFGGALFLARPAARPLALFGALWFVAAMSPNLNFFVSLGELTHDRYAYLSAPGLWLALGLACEGLAARVRAVPPAVRVAGAVAAFALLLAGLGAQRGLLFADTAPLFADAARVEPRSSYARVFNSVDLAVQANRAQAAGDEAAARALRERSFLELEAGVAAPDFDRYLRQPAARARLAVEYLARGRLDEAAAQARTALAAGRFRVNPADRSSAEQVLGLVALARGEAQAALDAFDRAQAAEPALSAIQINRAKALLALRDRAAASGAADEARALQERTAAALRAVRPDEPAYGEALEGLKLLEKVAPEK